MTNIGCCCAIDVSRSNFRTGQIVADNLEFKHRKYTLVKTEWIVEKCHVTRTIERAWINTTAHG